MKILNFIVLVFLSTKLFQTITKGGNKMIISQEEWNKRLEDVKLASQDCKTIEEIVQITDYSRSVINNLFRKFPNETEEVFVNLKNNKEKDKKVKATKKTKSRKQDYMTTSQKDDDFSIVMLDTSINLINNIFHILEKYVQDGKILGITDVALEELATLQKFDDDRGRSACNFLHIIKNNLSSFKLFEVKYGMRERETVDEAIINATLNLKKQALLLTSDKEMYIKAFLKGANVTYLSQKEEEEEKKEVFDVGKKSKTVAINKKYAVYVTDVVIENMQAIYVEKHRKNQFIKIFSKTGEEKQGERVTLEVGDHIFICTAKKDCIKFADYETYDSTQNNFLMRFNTRVYDFESEVNVMTPKYKKFIKEARKILTE